jgi:hypothetical protein
MKELENINESFASAGKVTPFKVPDGYFEKLPMQIHERCVGKSATEKTRIVPLWQVIRSQLALASGFAALALLGFVAYYYIQPTDHNQVVLSNDDYIEIVKRNIYDYDEGRLVKESGKYISYDSINNELKEDMIQYLLDQDIDYVTLMEQF